MNKYQFLAAVREGLDGLTKSDIEKSLDYYREIIDDRIDDGLTEEEAVAALGPVERIIAEIRAGAEEEKHDPVSKKADADSAKSEPEGSKGSSDEAKGFTQKLAELIKPFGGIVCGIVGICFWCVAISVLVAGASIGAASLALLFSTLVMLFTGELVQALLMLGGTLCCFGIGVLLTVGAIAAVRSYSAFAKKLRSAVSEG